MKNLLSYYHPKLPLFLTYMLQQVEYNPGKFLKWIMRSPDLTKVMHRQSLVWTIKARLLFLMICFFFGIYIFTSVLYILTLPFMGVISFALIPFFVILLTYLSVLVSWLYYEEPRRKRVIRQATKVFKKHPAIKVAISGSYGKTTMKELLLTVLSESKNVAATPGNKNVPISHASWSKKLTGEEEILLIEYGEAAPKDIEKLAKLTNPDYSVITGLAPNHLDEYKTLDGVAKDLLSIREFVDKDKIFINSASKLFKDYDISGLTEYSPKGVKGWKITDIKTDFDGTSFKMRKAKQAINVKSDLLGKHQVGPLAMVAALAYDLGLSPDQIASGMKKTKPFAHRMQPRMQQGAWIIDDTYNGSLEGFRAGINLMTDLRAKRKIYVTPGLVDQGEETENVHLEIGTMLAQANPDKIVLMQNSVTQYILKGLEEGEFKGNLQIEADPLTFYTNLEHILAKGDLVVMQNDWTDNYN